MNKRDGLGYLKPINSIKIRKSFHTFGYHEYEIKLCDLQQAQPIPHAISQPRITSFSSTSGISGSLEALGNKLMLSFIHPYLLTSTHDKILCPQHFGRERYAFTLADRGDKSEIYYNPCLPYRIF